MKQHHKKYRIWILLMAAVIVIFVGGCMKQQELTRYNAQFLQLFDTVTSITGYAKDKESFTSFAQEFHDKLEEYHKLYDIYNDYEGINNMKTINDNAGNKPVKVDRKIIDLLLFSKEMYQKTNGRMNIAMGSVLELWHQYRMDGIDNPQSAALPPMEELKRASQYTDMDKVMIDEAASTVYLEEGMRLDVGAIAKGYATERVCQELEAEGFDYAFISVGGNIRAIGEKTDGSLWVAGIQNPDLESEETYISRVGLKNQSLVTSGIYQRYYVVDGKSYHHIINPDTLMPGDAYLSVSVICRDSGVADALSTAVFNMDLEEGLALIESLKDTEAMWILKDGSQKYSSGFMQYTQEIGD